MDVQIKQKHITGTELKLQLKQCLQFFMSRSSKE